MVSIGRVWDRTTEVLGGRGGTLAGIAALAIFLPTVVRTAFTAYTAYGAVTPSHSGIVALIAIVAALATIWGQLAIVALSSDPAVTRDDATRIAARRLPAAIGIVLLLGIALAVLLVPCMVALGAALGPSSLVLMQAGVMPRIAPGAALFVTLYILALAIVFLVLGARLFLLNPVIVNERLGLRSIPRAFRLTRGLTWKLIGLLILYAIVLLVGMIAAQAVVGIVFRLILGAGVTAAFLGGVAGAAVTTALSVVATVFASQLYVAARDAAFTE
ncbi:hypothetical protein [Sphingomonas sp. CROZ-RG-20F-R02-07]|uniref:hypothetical protein n=1 Tax=Sphingomonas sp. CROZ-RG-20F-R02-07 TaxID=2914832 RepID=UPI001F592B9C|nr:hypothetical protein [Sphingomonas sp. CROZ-RG-20F-R02-07]